MRLNRIVLVIFVGLSLILAACTGPKTATPAAGVLDENQASVEATQNSSAQEMQGETGEEAMTDEGESQDMMETEDSMDAMSDEGAGDEQTSGDEAMEAGESLDEGSMATPEWFDRELVNVRSGDAFTINDYHGKVLLVETMAIWCTNCLQQQKQVLELHNLLGEQEDFISIGLDIDPFEQAPDLKNFVENNGFHWMYAVAPEETARDFSDLYGELFLNPPSTPMLIIDRHGEAHPLPFGIKTAADLMQALEPFLNDEGA